MKICIVIGFLTALTTGMNVGSADSVGKRLQKLLGNIFTILPESNSISIPKSVVRRLKGTALAHEGMLLEINQKVARLDVISEALKKDIKKLQSGPRLDLFEARKVVDSITEYERTKVFLSGLSPRPFEFGQFVRDNEQVLEEIKLKLAIMKSMMVGEVHPYLKPEIKYFLDGDVYDIVRARKLLKNLEMRISMWDREII